MSSPAKRTSVPSATSKSMPELQRSLEDLRKAAADKNLDRCGALLDQIRGDLAQQQSFLKPNGKELALQTIGRASFLRKELASDHS